MRILILAPWSVARPLHGGQIRCSRSAAAYRVAGHDVLVVGLYLPDTAQAGEYAPHDHPVTPALLQRAGAVPGTSVASSIGRQAIGSVATRTVVAA